MKKLFIILLFLVSSTILSPSVWAQTRITTVEFEGLSAFTEAQARAILENREGDVFVDAQVTEDVKKLYKSGLFSDVRAERQILNAGIKLVYHVVENRSIGKLTVSGNKKIKKDDIAEALKIRESDVLDPGKIAETKRAIFKLYEEKGYYLADITTRVEPFDADNNQIELVFDIDEGRSVKIRRIQFIGNKVFSDAKLRGKMKTKEKGSLSFLTSSGKFKDQVLDIDLKMLRYFYQDNGYLRATLSEPSVTLTRDKRSIYISITVSEGALYKVNSVAVAGDILTTEQELLAKMSLKEGMTYRKSLELQDIQTIEKIYGDQSYAFANIVPQIEADEQTHEAKITYVIQKGSKIKINKIIIRGNTVTRDKVIRRELRIFENAYFTQSGLEKSKVRLQQLGYFEDVNISTPRSDSDNMIDVIIEVKERQNTGTFSIGAGYSTLESFIFTASIQKDNFFGLGWSGGVSTNLSKLRQDVSLQMSDRYFLDTKWQFNFSLVKFHSAINPAFDEQRLGGSVSFGRELFDYFSVLVGYQVEDVSVSNFAAQVPAFFQANSSGFTSALTSQATYDRRDNRLFTTKGFYLSAGADYSDSPLGATNQFARYTADGRLFFPLPKKIILKGRSYFGYINSLDNHPVGLFDRYFLGGVNNLRGFDLNSVGPSISVPSTTTGGDSTFVYGGNKFMLFNAELQLPIYTPAGFQAVVFMDAGNAFGETENIDFTRLRSDYGFGFRWQSPIGPLRFEWGFPINRRVGESSSVFNFTIGQSF